MDRKKTIILWDDDIVWLEGLQTILENKGFACEEADSREEVYEIINEEENVVLCVLAKETVKKFFSTEEEMFYNTRMNIQIPIVWALENDAIDEEVSALRAGALEVVLKSREVEVAAERICLLIGRTSEKVYDKSIENRYGIENSKVAFEKKFQEIHLTITEKSVLFELYQRKGQVVGRKELIGKIWKNREGKDERVVDTVVKQLRKKLKNTAYQIQGVYGQGYRLKK